MIRTLNYYYENNLGKIETTLKYKQLEEYIKKDMEHDGTLRPIRLRNAIVKDGHIININIK